MQGAKTDTQLDEPCDICGDVGHKDLIVTCSKCLTAREHRYCMRSLAIDVPKFWICEACLSSNGIVSPQSGGEEGFLDPLVVAHHNVMHQGTCGKACADSEWQVCSEKLKLETGKVKFLPAEEAIRLSSGTLKMGSPRHNNPGLKYGPSSSIAPMSRRRTSSPCTIVTPKFSILREKANPNVMSSGSVKPPTNVGADISTTTSRHEVKTSKESKEDYGGKQWPGTMYMTAKEDKIFKAKNKEVKTADANSENTVYRVSYASATSEPKEIESSNKKIEKAMDDTSPLTVSPISSPGETFHAAEPENFGAEERGLLNISKLELYHRYRPALEDTWKGGFEYFDTATVGKFYGLFQAHPPCRVHRKVFEFSKKLPLMLQVKLLPRSHLWADLFGNDCPDFHDIALYFFPAADIQRSKQNFSCLFELLEIQNLVMRSYIDGVELLIFTSKQLHVDCQRIVARSSTEYFLWGIFRRVKSDHILHHSLELPSLVSTVECACDDHASVDNLEAIDMDIDMEGGRTVGPVDIVVLKELSGRPCGSHKEVDVDSAAEKMLFEPRMGRCKLSEQITCKVTSELPLEISKGKLVNAKDDSAFPSGFREIPVLKSRNIKEKTGVVDGGVIHHVKKKNVDIHGESEAAFGATSPQPERFLEDSTITSQKHNQQSVQDLACDPLAVFAPPFSVKTGAKIEDKGNDDENPHRTWEKKDLEVEAESKMNIPLCWRPPPKNWVKLNIEGSSTGGLSSAGAGGIIRDESGKWLLGYSKNLGTSEGIASELWALYHGLDLVWEHGFRKVLVESVSRETLKCLKQPTAFLDANRDLIQCCKDLLNRNWDCKLQLIFRKGNLCANWLATHCDYRPLGSLAVFDCPPHKLVPIFQKDSTGIVQSHSCYSPKGFPD